MTDEPTTQPDASQVALVLSGAFEEAYAALSAAWEAAAQSSPGEVQNALAAADQALQTIAEQVGQDEGGAWHYRLLMVGEATTTAGGWHGPHPDREAAYTAGLVGFNLAVSYLYGPVSKPSQIEEMPQ